MADLTTVGVRSATSTRAVPNWRKSFARRLTITDAVALVWVMFGTEVVWLGWGSTVDAKGVPMQVGSISYSLVSLIIVVVWMLALHVFDTRTDRVIGTGAAEYKQIFDATLRVFFLVAIVAFLFKLDLARGYVLISLPLGLLSLFLARWFWRQWLHIQRAYGDYSSRVVLVGSRNSVAHIATELRRASFAGYAVVGAIVPGESEAVQLSGGDAVPIVGNVDAVTTAMDETGADTVVITGANELSPDRVRRISWALEPGRRHLVVAPSLTDVGGPRIHTRPVAGLPLMHVETPRYNGGQRITKRVFDVVVSGLLLVVLSPVFLLVGLAIKLTSTGPVLFRQQRVGLDGKPFTMLKFRSMVVDAEARLAALQQLQRDAGNTVLFKLQHDPRITPIGSFIRRFSIDELPQLINVFLGSMSLVGPRPSLERELEMYDEHTHRRFLVSPGITGLWQVSGRSNLTWEESVRIDLYYVENWSIAGDLQILWRTARAVFASDGAY